MIKRRIGVIFVVTTIPVLLVMFWILWVWTWQAGRTKESQNELPPVVRAIPFSDLFIGSTWKHSTSCFPGFFQVSLLGWNSLDDHETCMKHMANSRDLWNQSWPSRIHRQCAANIVAHPYISHRKVARTPLLHVKGWTRLCNNSFMTVDVKCTFTVKKRRTPYGIFRTNKSSLGSQRNQKSRSVEPKKRVMRV